MMDKGYLNGAKGESFSFINIVDGKEEIIVDSAGACSSINRVESAAVRSIINTCFKEWLLLQRSNEQGKPIHIVVVSPYTAQVELIKDELAHDRYDVHNQFIVNVQTMDAWQGGKVDMVIFSTVGTHGSSNSVDSIKHVAVTTSASLWILGNERTLVSQANVVWQKLVGDVKQRGCFFYADDDHHLKKAIIDSKTRQDQLEDLLHDESVLLRNTKWKVVFCKNFLQSFKNLRSTREKKSVIILLEKLSIGWRPEMKKTEKNDMLLRQAKLEGMHMLFSNDIVLKDNFYTQVLKVWDILPQDQSPQLVKRLKDFFDAYTDDFRRCCTEIRTGKDVRPSAFIIYPEVEVPVTWGRAKTYIESFKERTQAEMSDMAMTVLGLTLSESNPLDLPFQLSDEQQEVVSFPRSTFVLGRSGTGKTTVLTTKLLQMEKNFKTSGKHTLLRQLFVTVSPRLCQAIKGQIVRLQRSIFGDNSSVEEDDGFDAADDQFKNLPDSFVTLPANQYPLVITFDKFIRMLDGTVAVSYFERFSSQPVNRSDLESIIREKQVTFSRFHGLYWPRFNSKDTKTLDPSRVFTEIISHIKGFMQAEELDGGAMDREKYISLADRASSFNREKRETIYGIYQKYEELKKVRKEFDICDIVADLHHRLRTTRYKGDTIDYVYIDEVQDLTMSQICLLKYVCPNAEHGFIFSGDTAQTIARGADIRFEDIKTLFYHKFMGESSRTFQKKEKGKMVSDIFLLTQNFRTHDGVLKLYQSVIDLLSHFFPDSIDRLKPETSLIIGEPPIVLQCQKSKDEIEKILGSQGGSFGAQQVILVRDLSEKKDVLEHVESRSLVLTISECKGLEFEDVLLYNFFGSSPFKNQWRVIYGFMKELGMPVPITQKFPSFDPSRHGIMCYELKQLYVAITRTRNRLWILDDKQDSVEPMFDYWRSKELVQLKDLDESFVTKMKVESSSQDWKTRGHELYDQKNYEAATMCFEKAEDFIWVQKSKAAGQINPDEAIKDGDKEGLKMDMQMEKKKVTPKVPGRFEEGSQLWNTFKDLISIIQASKEQEKKNKKEEEDQELTQASGAAALPNADTEGEASEATRPGDGGKVLEEGNISKKKSKKGISKGRRKGR